MTVDFIEAMRGFLHDPATKAAFRGLPSDFTRDRCFTFPVTCVSILKDHARPAQTRLLHLFEDKAFGTRERCPTASAFFQAREKVLPCFFQEWTSQAVQFYYANYTKDSLVTTWRGMRVWGIDCSWMNLPDNAITRHFYSIQKNQIPDSETVGGLASFAYDLLNDIPISACLEKVQAERDLAFKHHFDHFTPDTLAIYDRGYADYAVAAKHLMHGFHFVIRCPISSTFKAVEDFVKSGKDNIIVTIPATKRHKAEVKQGIFPAHITVRLVKVVLSTGEIEVLMTSLLDQKKFKIADFKWLYAKRWGVEKGFLRFKHQLEAECFSSGKVYNIKQDFHAMVFLQVLEAILNKHQDRLIKAQSVHDSLKHVYRVNKSGAYRILTDHLVGLLLSNQTEMIAQLNDHRSKI
nr:transposase [Candidatus Sigynarchaeota archaeon]